MPLAIRRDPPEAAPFSVCPTCNYAARAGGLRPFIFRATQLWCSRMYDDDSHFRSAGRIWRCRGRPNSLITSWGAFLGASVFRSFLAGTGISLKPCKPNNPPPALPALPQPNSPRGEPHRKPHPPGAGGVAGLAYQGVVGDRHGSQASRGDGAGDPEAAGSVEGLQDAVVVNYDEQRSRLVQHHFRHVRAGLLQQRSRPGVDDVAGAVGGDEEVLVVRHQTARADVLMAAREAGGP